MVRVNLPGIKIVKKRLTSGKSREYHYAYLGGPLIWKTGREYGVGSMEYLVAYRTAHEEAGQPQSEPARSRSTRK